MKPWPAYEICTSRMKDAFPLVKTKCETHDCRSKQRREGMVGRKARIELFSALPGQPWRPTWTDHLGRIMWNVSCCKVSSVTSIKIQSIALCCNQNSDLLRIYLTRRLFVSLSCSLAVWGSSTSSSEPSVYVCQTSVAHLTYRSTVGHTNCGHRLAEGVQCDHSPADYKTPTSARIQRKNKSWPVEPVTWWYTKDEEAVNAQARILCLINCCCENFVFDKPPVPDLKPSYVIWTGKCSIDNFNELSTKQNVCIGEIILLYCLQSLRF